MDERLFAVVLLLIAVLQIIARATRLPYPIVFVLAGVALALIPGTPNVAIRPELVFLIFLPPLLFGDAWTTDVRQFRRYLTPIALLATGPVIVTTLGVAWLAHAMLGLPYAVGATLGAILAPTDAVATEAIAEEVGLPLRLTTILSGESLVNDATGLVLFRFAVAAVTTGAFSLGSAFGLFVYSAVVGIAIGLVGGYVIMRVTRALNRSGLGETSISITISIVAPYALYVPADAIGASGVLAAVAGGMYLSRKTMEIFDADSRIAASAVWNLLFSTFNGTLFILIGLQLRSILASLAKHPPLELATFSIAVTLAVIGLRFAWVFPASRLRWWLGGASIRRREGTPPPWQATFLLGWAGMRGMVSLAAALAIPERTAGGQPFPERDLILFTTFVVILATLLVEGLSLPWLIRRLNISALEEDADPEALARARVALAGAAIARLHTLEPEFSSPTHWEVAGRLRAEYEQQQAHYRAHVEGVDTERDAQQHDIDRQLRRSMYEATRSALVGLRRSGEIPDRVYRDLEYDIDLAESRLA